MEFEVVRESQNERLFIVTDSDDEHDLLAVAQMDAVLRLVYFICSDMEFEVVRESQNERLFISSPAAMMSMTCSLWDRCDSETRVL